MNYWDCFIIIMLVVFLNTAVFMIFKKYLYGKSDAAMKFLVINIFKDILWLIISLIIIDKTRENFLFIVICFIVASFFIYLPVIKRINKS